MPRLAASALIVVSLTAVHQYLGPLRYTRPSLTLLLLFGAIAFLAPHRVRWSNLRAAWPSKVVGAVLLFTILSTIFGLSPGGSFFYLRDHYFKVVVFFVALVIAIRRTEDLLLLTWTFTISVGILTLLSLTVMETQSTRSGLARLAGQGMFDSNDMGMLVLMGMPIARLVQQNSGPIGRWVSGLILFTAPVTIALTGSRGALAGFAVILPFLMMSIKGVSAGRKLGIMGGLAVALLFAAPSGYWQQMQTTFNTEEDYNYTDAYGRVEIAKRGIGYMLQYPVFGVGIRNFPRAEGTISPILEERQALGLPLMWVSPHNTFVQVGAELGVPALFLWVGMLIAGGLGLLRLRKRIPESWERQSPQRRFLRDACLFLPLTYLAFATTSFFLTHAYTTPIYIVLALTAGVLVLVRREQLVDRRTLLRLRTAGGLSASGAA